MSEIRKSFAELQKSLQTLYGVVPKGSAWMHGGSGDVYVVKQLCYRESDVAVLVLYHSVAAPAVLWTRPITEFLDGRFKRQPG